MAQFKYIAKSRTGERQEGTLDAPDKRAAMLQLGRLGLVPISVSDLQAKAAAPAPADKAKEPPKPAAKPAAAPAPGAPPKKWFRFEKGVRTHSRMKRMPASLASGTGLPSKCSTL